MKSDSVAFKNSQGYAQIGAEVIGNVKSTGHRVNDTKKKHHSFVNVRLVRVTGLEASAGWRAASVYLLVD